MHVWFEDKPGSPGDNPKDGTKYPKWAYIVDDDTTVTGPVPRPTGFTASAGSDVGSIDLNWHRPASDPVRYRIEQLQPRGPRQPSRSPTGSRWRLRRARSTSQPVAGLVVGEQYTFRIRAELAGADWETKEGPLASGWEQTSGTPAAAPRGGALKPPAAFQARGTDSGTIELSWTTPTGPAPGNYKIEQENASRYLPLDDVSASPHSVRGLTPGSRHSFRIRSEHQIEDRSVTDPDRVSLWVYASGRAGTGGGDNEPPVAVGSIPDVELEPGAAGAVVRNVAPFFNDPDGDALTYTCTLTDARIAACDPVTSSTGSFTITGKQIGSTTVTVTATEVVASGTGLSATQTFTVTVSETVYAGVGDLTLVPSDRSILVSWTPPTDSGTPTRYEIQWAEGEDRFGRIHVTTHSSYNISGLEPSTRYRVQVRAAYGPRATEVSRWSAGDATTTDLPVNQPPRAAAPLAAVELQIGTSAKVNIAAAFTDDDDPDSSLTYDAFSGRTDVVLVSRSGMTLTVTGLKLGVSTVTVTADDGNDGPGRPARQTFEVTVVPGPVNQPPEVVRVPAAVTITRGGTAQVDVSSTFSDPENDPLTYAGRSDRPDVVSVVQSGPALFTLRGVSVGSAAVTITATDNQPNRVPVPASFAVTVDERENSPPQLVGEVPDVVAVIKGATVTVSLVFTDPDGDRLVYTATSARPDMARVRASATRTGVDVAVTGVGLGDTPVTVLSSDGRLSTPVTLAVKVLADPDDVPGDPVDVVAEAGQSSVQLRWRPGTPPGDRFRVRWREIVGSEQGTGRTDGQWVDAGPRSGTTFTLSNLQEATTYRLEVRAEIGVTLPDPAAPCYPFCSSWVGAEATTGRGNQPPAAVGEIPGVSIVAGDVAARNVGPYFEDPDGDELTYSAVVTDALVARVERVGGPGEFGILGIKGGQTDVAVTARDPGGLTVVQRFAVEVEPPPPPVLALDAPDGTLFFDPGGSVRIEVEIVPASIFNLTVSVRSSSDFVLDTGSGTSSSAVELAIPAGTPSAFFHVREKVPVLRPRGGPLRPGRDLVPGAARVRRLDRPGLLEASGHPHERAARAQQGELQAQRLRPAARRVPRLDARQHPDRAAACACRGRLDGPSARPHRARASLSLHAAPPGRRSVPGRRLAPRPARRRPDRLRASGRHRGRAGGEAGPAGVLHAGHRDDPGGRGRPARVRRRRAAAREPGGGGRRSDPRRGRARRSPGFRGMAAYPSPRPRRPPLAVVFGARGPPRAPCDGASPFSTPPAALLTAAFFATRVVGRRRCRRHGGPRVLARCVLRFGVDAGAGWFPIRNRLLQTPCPARAVGRGGEPRWRWETGPGPRPELTGSRPAADRRPTTPGTRRRASSANSTPAGRRATTSRSRCRLGHADDVPRGCAPAMSATLFIEEEVDGRLLDLGRPAELHVSPDGVVVVPSIGAWGVIVLGLLLAAGGAPRPRRRGRRP